jgi:hypothetical protein
MEFDVVISTVQTVLIVGKVFGDFLLVVRV